MEHKHKSLDKLELSLILMSIPLNPLRHRKYGFMTILKKGLRGIIRFS